MTTTNKQSKIVGGHATGTSWHRRIKRFAKRYSSRVNRRVNRRAARLDA